MPPNVCLTHFRCRCRFQFEQKVHSAVRSLLDPLVSSQPDRLISRRVAPPPRLPKSKHKMKFDKVLVMEVESAKDKHPDTLGGKYRRDTPWLVEAFRKKGRASEVIFITSHSNAEELVTSNPKTAFIGRVNPMDYDEISMSEYMILLKELKEIGVLFGPEADLVDLLGSKLIVYGLSDTALGIEGVRLHHYEAMQENDGEIDEMLARAGPPRVLKMLRGSTGLGVWKLKNVGDGDLVEVTDAYTQKTEELPRDAVIPKFLALCSEEDAISMPFLPLIKEGEIRFLMSRHEVLAIIHKCPVDETGFTATLRAGAVYNAVSLADNKKLVDDIVKWSRDICKILAIREPPYWWSIDCIEEKFQAEVAPSNYIMSTHPERRLVLSEINCSCLGLVADTSAEAAQKGQEFADLIANIILD